MIRQVKDRLKRAFLTLHKLGIRAGIHILPVHYYSPVPNILELQETKSVWAKKSELPGVTIDLDEQSSNLTSICLPYQREYAGNQVYRQAITGQFGPGFGYIEAQALHGVLRCFKPARVIEVGSGASTWCTLAALEMNRRETGRAAQITCIEPYPSERLRALPQIALIARQVQSVPFQLFTQLGEGDLLFIDSSHMVKPGSDVNYLILEVVPRLQHGVMVHFHDIYLPYDYPPDTLQTFVHGTETSLLRAFLMFNNRVKILFCLSHLHYDRRDILAKVFPEYDPQSAVDGLRDGKYKPFENPRQHFPASIYVRIQG